MALTALDLMEAQMSAEARVRKATGEYLEAFTAPLRKMAEVKAMLAAGGPSPDSKPDTLQAARRAAKLARGEVKE